MLLLSSFSRCLHTRQYTDVPRLVSDTLRWCTSTLFRIGLDLEEIDTTSTETYEPLKTLAKRLKLWEKPSMLDMLQRSAFCYII